MNADQRTIAIIMAILAGRGYMAIRKWDETSKTGASVIDTDLLEKHYENAIAIFRRASQK